MWCVPKNCASEHAFGNRDFAVMLREEKDCGLCPQMQGLKDKEKDRSLQVDRRVSKPQGQERLGTSQPAKGMGTFMKSQGLTQVPDMLLFTSCLWPCLLGLSGLSDGGRNIPLIWSRKVSLHVL